MAKLKKVGRFLLVAAEHLPGLALVLIAGFTATMVFGQAQVDPSRASASFLEGIPGGGSPWFWVFVFWYVFSAGVTSMPEPTTTSNDFYIWIYRWFHILSAAGTSFFQNKMDWKIPKQSQEDRSLITKADVADVV